MRQTVQCFFHLVLKFDCRFCGELSELLSPTTTLLEPQGAGTKLAFHAFFIIPLYYGLYTQLSFFHIEYYRSLETIGNYSK